MFVFFTNFLEPFAFLFYFLGLFIYTRRAKQKTTKLLTFYYLIAFVLGLIGSFAVHFSDSNIWLYDIMALLTSIFLGRYFYQTLQSPAKKRTALILTIVYVLYAIYRNLTLEGDRLFDSIGYAIISASVSVYVFMYFHQLLKNVSETNLLTELNFWLSSGYLLYFAGNFIIFVTYYYFTLQYLKYESRSDAELLTALWGLHNVLLFISALSLLIGSLWITYRKRSA